MEEVRWKLVVLDDDPTGIQTVHGCLLITQWDEESVREAFEDEQPFFYILTNTRAMTREEAEHVTREAMEMVIKVNQSLGEERGMTTGQGAYRLIVVSRSDSCLRGHFPLETDVIRRCLVHHGLPVMKKTPFCPAFIEAGRVTINGVHYLIEKSNDESKRLIPVSETEFARDNVFAYHTSTLSEYIKEKGANPDDYEIVNAQSYDELRAFAQRVLTTSLSENVVIRSSSSLPKAISGIADIPLLDRSIVKHEGVGCFIVGSHVKKTTIQLEHLLAEEGTCGMEIDVQRIIDDPNSLMQETLTIIKQIAEEHLTPVVYTSRQEIRLNDTDQRQHLGQQVSNFLVDIVRNLPYTPSYLVGKGGITSHDIMTKGLNIRSTRVLGQVVNSVPCVMTKEFPYIIFPGNVGNEQSLKEVYLLLKG